MRDTDHDDLKRRVNRIGKMLDDIAEAQEELKREKKGAESAGYDLKALMQVVKEARTPEVSSAQLELELVLDAYREGAGLPTRSSMALGQAVDNLTRDSDVTVEGNKITIKSKKGARSESVLGA